jgi:hypothetical protein
VTPQFIWQMLRCVVFCKFLPLTCLEVIHLVFSSSVPELSRCQIYQPGLVDPQLKQTYKNIPKLPRYSIDGISYF